MKPSFFHAAILLALTASTGCAPAIEPLRVRASELSKLPADAGTNMPSRPIVIEFAEGDMVPIDLSFSGEMIELTPPSPGLAFRAKRRFFVRVGVDGIKVSTDGVNFGERPKVPGSFRLGLSVKPQGARVEIDVKMPKRTSEGG